MKMVLYIEKIGNIHRKVDKTLRVAMNKYRRAMKKTHSGGLPIEFLSSCGPGSGIGVYLV